MVMTDSLVHFLMVSLTFRDKFNCLTAICFLIFWSFLLEIIATEKERYLVFLVDMTNISYEFGKELRNLVHRIGNNDL